MADHTGPCAHCGETFSRSRSGGPAPRYCSATCRARAKDERNKASGKYDEWRKAQQAKRIPIRHDCTCTVCGEPFKSRMATAKYCKKQCASKAFNTARVADGRLIAQRRGRADQIRAYAKAVRHRYVKTRACLACGTEYRTTHAETKHCASLMCHYFARAGVWPSSPIPDRHPIRSTRLPDNHPARVLLPTPQKVRFLVGRCLACDAWFIADRQACSNHTDRTCGPRCTSRYQKSLRRARKRLARVEVFARREIFERDKWMCHLCRKKVHRKKVSPHPMSPTLDHVIPLADGGEHSRANVRTAHFICNAIKGAGGGDEQLMLIG